MQAFGGWGFVLFHLGEKKKPAMYVSFAILDIIIKMPLYLTSASDYSKVLVGPRIETLETNISYWT